MVHLVGFQPTSHSHNMFILDYRCDTQLTNSRSFSKRFHVFGYSFGNTIQVLVLTAGLGPAISKLSVWCLTNLATST